MRAFAVHFSMRKDHGPGSFPKAIDVGLDDLPAELTQIEIEALAIAQAEEQLYRSEDYKLYGRNWTVTEVMET